ncbi:MAG: C-GCAxxG-C-C family protein [Sphaerochaetaceae bacterium]
MEEAIREIVTSVVAGFEALKGAKIAEKDKFIKAVVAEYRLAVESSALAKGEEPFKGGDDLPALFAFCVDLSLFIRTSGELPFYSAKLLALWFSLDESDDLFVQRINAFRSQVGLKDALRSFSKLDREVELIQLVYEQFEAIEKKEKLNPPEEQVRILKAAYREGFNMEVQYHGCSQCVLLALGRVFRPVHPDVFKAATSLSGGIAQCGDGACGAYSGGVMYMGIHMGRSLEKITGDKENQYRSFAMAQRLHDKYVETYGGVTGEAVHKAVFKRFYLLRDPQDKLVFSEAKAHELVCPTVVGSAARWVAQIMMDEKLI